MKMLVLGGAGYIGSHVVRELLDSGHQVTVFDNLSSGLTQNLFEDAQFVRGDILNEDELDRCISSGFDGAVHLSAFKAAGESMIDPGKYSVNNICGTINIINSLTTHGIRFLVFSSSAAVYGNPQYQPIDENHPTIPVNYYGFTKLEIERFLRWYDELKGLKFAALRYFNAAGYDSRERIHGLEQNPANLLPVIMEAACGIRDSVKIFGDDYETRDGTGVRDYIHVSDLARGHVQSLNALVKTNQSITVNLGSETGVSVFEMLEAARRITGKTISADVVARRPGDPAELVSTAAFASEKIGWKATSSDVDSLVETSWKAYTRNMS